MGTLEELEKMKVELEGYIFEAATVEERQKLAKLEAEVSAGRKQVKELNAKAYEVAIANKAQIKIHLDEAERLRLESLDLSIDEWQLEIKVQGMQQEMYQLEEIIKDKEIAV